MMKIIVGLIFVSVAAIAGAQESDDDDLHLCYENVCRMVSEEADLECRVYGGVVEWYSQDERIDCDGCPEASRVMNCEDASHTCDNTECTNYPDATLICRMWNCNYCTPEFFLPFSSTPLNCFGPNPPDLEDVMPSC